MRNKYSYLSCEELLRCRSIVDSLPAGDAKDFSTVLLQRLEEVYDELSELHLHAEHNAEVYNGLLEGLNGKS